MLQEKLAILIQGADKRDNQALLDQLREKQRHATNLCDTANTVPALP